jgi:hypothetical protein
MSAIHRGLLFLLCAASIAFFGAPHASAQTSGPGICAVLAAKNAFGTARQVKPPADSISQQVIQIKRYLKCLQSQSLNAAPGVSAKATAEAFVIFDVPGSTCLPAFSFCTRPTAINNSEAIIGIYADASGAPHGFLRTRDGAIATIDPPGSVSNFPSDISPAGVITGNYCDNTTCHGYLRSPYGAFTTFDPAGSVFTQANGINPVGAITGSYDDANFVAHGFLRASNGAFTTFDAPGSTALGGTFPLEIDPAGTIMGQYCDDTTCHGFLRTSDGTFITFDPAGSVYTSPGALNPEGAITGSYTDVNFVTHGFLRAKDGAFTMFDVPGSLSTGPTSINPSGAITGIESPPSHLHGFLRARDGAFTIFDVPGSQYTWRVAGITPAGAIAGSYLLLDAGGICCLERGFLRTP